MLVIKEEVKKALEEGRAVVALESTIIAHGMPYPENLETAKAVEAIVREAGAVPATMAILDGVLKVGLDDEELEYLATTKEALKVSRRDLPYVVSEKKSGATTVAATMIMAKMAGIKVFVTGGVGGVHREGEKSMDVSADLTELSKTSVAVVCAGSKSILDIGRTLEVLETQGVPVLGYKTDEFPSFYTRRSGHPVDFNMDVKGAASLIKTKWDLGLEGGVLFTVPIPEEHELDAEEIEEAIQRALEEAKKLKISGKKVTPYLLDELKRVTDGKSLKANIELVYNNARVGSQLAVELASLE
ncbi:MAG: pseudouridine-5'-phosphate glycosidase [Tissierellia bacterium]|nr:pseudouridine-5'-phosphate glycosidase [Tissierellia bacterium]